MGTGIRMGTGMGTGREMGCPCAGSSGGKHSDTQCHKGRALPGMLVYVEGQGLVSLGSRGSAQHRCGGSCRWVCYGRRDHKATGTWKTFTGQ